MKVNVNNLTAGEFELVKWQYRLHGDFKTALWKTITLADESNLALLKKAFPIEVEEYVKFTRVSGYWSEVQRKAGIAVGT